MERKYRFVTNRLLKNKNGEEKGRLKAMVKTGSDTAEADYTCPECGHSEHLEVEFVRPFKVRCSKCGFLMRVSKLKDEMKREKKKEDKERRERLENEATKA